MALTAHTVSIDRADPAGLTRSWTGVTGYRVTHHDGVAWRSGLGTTAVAEHHEGGFTWSALADPEGNEFCAAGQD
jgi:hypothetical protein